MPMLKTSFIQYDHTPLTPKPDGIMSYGMAVDQAIGQALESGKEIQTLEVYFEPSEWNELAREHHEKRRAR
jgi:hypothetical protein